MSLGINNCTSVTSRGQVARNNKHNCCQYWMFWFWRSMHNRSQLTTANIRSVTKCSLPFPPNVNTLMNCIYWRPKISDLFFAQEVISSLQKCCKSIKNILQNIKTYFTIYSQWWCLFWGHDLNIARKLIRSHKKICIWKMLKQESSQHNKLFFYLNWHFTWSILSLTWKTCIYFIWPN